jgi:hypothetical protein
MSKKTSQSLRDLPETFNLDTSADPVAHETQWEPMQDGGANFRTRKLVARGTGQLRFRFTFQTLLALTIVATIGSVFLCLGIGMCRKGILLLSIVVGFPFCFVGGMAILVALGCLRASLRPIVFDKSRRFYWKRYAAPRPSSHAKNTMPLAHIHAIQLVIRTSSLQNGELNLINGDGDRTHVTTDCDRHRLIRTARRLAEFLAVPLWNALPDSPQAALPVPTDPLITIDDPVARLTQWSPVEDGGANYATHALRQLDTDRIAFKPIGMGIKLPWIFIISGSLVGVALLAMNIYRLRDGTLLTMADGSRSLLAMIPLLLLFTLVPAFLAVGIFVLRRETQPRRFDKRTGWYWQSRTSIRLAETNKSHPDLDLGAPLAHIHALQLVSQLVLGIDSDTQPYTSYDLNVVLHDGRRIKVVGHGDGDQLRSDAEKLSEFLDVPIWDATRQS